jgi:hypothetical protein
MSRQIQGRTWLEAYLEYVAETESPDIYRFWAGVSAISTTLKKSVFVKRGHHLKIFPNHYIVLVGPPGIGKGTAMNPAINLVKKANVAHYMEDRISAEKAIENLANGFQATKSQGSTLALGKDHCATAVAAELSLFLSTSDWILPLLCTMWDRNEFTYDTKKNGNQQIKDLSFGLFGGCTPQYIREVNKDAQAAIASGFTARTVFAWASKKGQTIAWPENDPSALEDPLVNDLRYISQNLMGEFSFSKDAKKTFIEFYEEMDSSQTEAEFDAEVLTNFRARMWSHVTKLAMILAVAENDVLIIEKHHIDQAILHIRQVYKDLDITFRGVGESTLVEAMERIMAFIETRGVCTRREIMRHNYRHITDEDLTRVLITLSGMGFCFETTQGKDFKYMYNKNFKASNVVKTKGASGTP